MKKQNGSRVRGAVSLPGIVRFRNDVPLSGWDELAREEPLEIRLVFEQDGLYRDEPVSVTLRTPGEDHELAIGFLFAEGIIDGMDDLRKTESGKYLHPSDGNRVSCYVTPGKTIDLARLQRHFYTASSCGICGKASLEAVRAIATPIGKTDGGYFTPEMLQAIPGQFLDDQTCYQITGGLHAAAWFDADGARQCVREDVGRHNAVDKLIGYSLLNKTGLTEGILAVSGRAGFELVHKAARAGISMFVAFGAPTSLAVELAEEMNMTLVGFLREDRFNVYTGSHRIVTNQQTIDSYRV